jgi:hypothetical protein
MHFRFPNRLGGVLSEGKFLKLLRMGNNKFTLEINNFGTSGYLINPHLKTVTLEQVHYF